MSYYTAKFLVRAHRFGVPFPKLQTFSQFFLALHIDYSQYEETILGIFVYLCIYEVTTTKIIFVFINSAAKPQHVLFENEPFLYKMPASFLALIFLYTLEKIPWKNYVRFWKWNLKRTSQSAQNSFLRKSTLKFCIIFNMISFVNVHGSVKIRLAFQKPCY